MAVDHKHKQYQAMAPLWRKCRLVLEGEEAVKEAGTEFLPSLSGQTAAEYDAYKDRAMFFGAAGRTRSVMLGAVFTVPPSVQAPPSMMPMLKHVTRGGHSIETFSVQLVEELFTTARYGVLVDMATDGTRPYLVGYPAESIINWRTRLVEGVEVLEQVVLMEEHPAPKDEFDDSVVPKIRVLGLDERGAYYQRLYRQADDQDPQRKNKWIEESSHYPTARGKLLAQIPFVFVGLTDLTSCARRPPMLDLVNINVSHYRSSADLEHGRHFTALPTPWAAGFDRKSELHLGASTAWVSEESSARCGFLEFTGQGLSALQEALVEKQQLMSILGSRLLEGDKNSVESAETLRMKRLSERSVLASVANNVGEALRQCLEWMRDWLGTTGEVDVELNDDFVDFQLDPAMLSKLMEAVQAGLMSWDVFYYNVKRAGLYPDGQDKETELGLIEIGLPIAGTGMGGGAETPTTNELE